MPIKTVIGLLCCGAVLVAGCTLPTPAAPTTPAATTATTTPATITDTATVSDSTTITGTATVSDSTTITSTDAITDTTTGEARPMTAAACAALQSDVAQALGVAVNREDAAAFTSAFGVLTGASCRLSATGTGENFTNFVDVSQQLIALFTAQGWTQDMQYVADGPTGTVVGLRQQTANENELAIIAVNWTPAPDVTCPQDQPIAACAEQLAPDQMLYTIIIDLVAAE